MYIYSELSHLQEKMHLLYYDDNNNNKKKKEDQQQQQCIKRHDKVCAQLHFNMCKERGVKLDNEPWYDHVP
jgi:hypothetical protein